MSRSRRFKVDLLLLLRHPASSKTICVVQEASRNHEGVAGNGSSNNHYFRKILYEAHSFVQSPCACSEEILGDFDLGELEGTESRPTCPVGPKIRVQEFTLGLGGPARR